MCALNHPHLAVANTTQSKVLVVSKEALIKVSTLQLQSQEFF